MFSEAGLPAAVTAFKDQVINRATSTDLISYTQSARMEPLVSIDSRLRDYPDLLTLLDTGLNIYTAYLLQAVALEVQVSNVAVAKRLDKFATHRSVSGALRAAAMESLETIGLPMSGTPEYYPSLEAVGKTKPTHAELLELERERAERKNTIYDEYDRDANRRRSEDAAVDRDHIYTTHERDLNRRRAEDAAADRTHIYNGHERDLNRQRSQDSAKDRLDIDRDIYANGGRDHNEQVSRDKAAADAKIKRELEDQHAESDAQRRKRRALEDAEIAAEVSRRFPNAQKPGDVTFSDASKMVNDAQNLAVGKLINVKIESNGHSATIPLTVRLVPAVVANTTMKEILSVGGRDNSVYANWLALKAGQMQMLRDGLLCTNVIVRHRRAAMRDASGTYMAAHNRAENNALASIVSGQPSLGTASSIYLVDDATRREVEREIGGRFSDFKTRERIFDTTMSMIMIVVDQDHDVITFYHRTIEQPTTLTSAALRRSGAKGSDNIMDVLKLFIDGRAPSRL